MFRNYLKTAFRNLGKNKLYSGINIIGLTTGLAACLLIGVYIIHELSYDKFNTQASNIYRVTSESESTSGKTNLAVTPPPWVPLMKKDLPEINNYVRIFKAEKSIVGQPGQQKFYENDLLYADSTFFDVFSFSLLKGNRIEALKKPNSIVLAKETAEK